MINENPFAKSEYKKLRDRILPTPHTFRSILNVFQEVFRENSNSDYTCAIAQKVFTDSVHPYHFDIARCIGWQSHWEVSPSILNVSLRYRSLPDWYWVEPLTFGDGSESLCNQELFRQIYSSELFTKYAECESDYIEIEFQGAEEFDEICKWFPNAVRDAGLLDGCSSETMQTFCRKLYTEA